MNKIILAGLVGLAICVSAFALDLVDVPNEGGPYQIKQTIASNNVLLEADATTQGLTNAALLALFTARSFSTTGELAVISTAYTPRYRGELLYNVTSNVFWAAKGVTTNDWLLLN